MKKAEITQFHKALARWYAKHGRHELPWRNTRDPYAIYLSEIMLQQTQVETVRTRFYPQFLAKFPTIEKLAKANAEDVLSAWQGLGYYSRAGNLHKAAQACKTSLPQTVDALIALPGIGKNTAHAVGAFAFNLPVPVMEANVKRVLCRIFALTNPNDKELWARAEELLNRAEPFDYNQAMMDIGSMVCTKSAPKCGECPANTICVGQKAPQLYPQPKIKKTVPIRTRTIVLMMDAKGRVQATPRTTRFLGGMYHFTELETKAPKGAVKLGEISQSYSHFTLEASVYIIHSTARGGNDFYTLKELHALPMSMAEKKILRLFESSLRRTK